MSKEYEKLRQKIAKEYKEKVSALEKQVKNLQKENLTLKEKNSLLESEIISKNEWIERLLEYCNLSKEELTILIESEKSKEKMRELFLGVSNILNQYK